MKKRWWLAIAVLFVLVGPALTDNDQVQRRKMEKSIQALKKDNELFCQMLNKMLDSLCYHPKSYQKAAEFRTKAQKARHLISQSEKQLKDLEKEKNEVVVLEKLDKISNDLIITSLLHREIIIFFLNVFAPLLGIEPFQETFT